MKVPLLDLKGQYNSIRAEVDAAIKKVSESQDFILGGEVKALEDEMAAYCCTGYAVGVASGTDALILALKALNIKEGDEVIVPSFTFIATAEAVSLIGAKPVFCDIDPKTYNIDPALMAKRVTKKTKAVIPVHLYGQCADMDQIITAARKHGLKVIEDNAQAIGATYKGNKSGSMGDIGCLSFFPSKNLGGFGDGGMIVTGNKALADKIRVLRVHGSAVRYIHSEIGMNSRLDNIQAAVLRIKLRHLDGWLDKRRENAAYYNDAFKGLPVITPYVPDRNVHTYHQYAFRIKSGREKLAKFLNDNGVEARAYYPIPLHLQDCYKGLGYKKGDLKESESASAQVLSIAVYPELRLEEKESIVSKIKEYFRR